MDKRPIDLLVDKGVRVAAPACVELDNEIDTDRISGKQVTIHAGCKLFGKNTLICEGVELGFEGPVTLNNCYVGPNVKLKGGYFENAVFLEGAQAGSGSHVRGGTILEEQANIAHTVGLKQTILFPFVTLGSLINFCDCLMAGGTSRTNHSEVGSSYIHFNFTPDQDKATASLIGDVPKGVMLNQSPIFLGGQGGLVGPCQIAYGTVVAAGSICRKDQLKEDRLVLEGSMPNARMPLSPGTYRNLKRILKKNFTYIGHLFALMQWYKTVRQCFVGTEFPQPLLDGLVTTLQSGIKERIKQLGRLKEKVAEISKDQSALHVAFCNSWEEVHASLLQLQGHEGQTALKATFLTALENGIQQKGKNYLEVIQHLDSHSMDSGSQWLQSIVDHLTADLFSILESAKQ